MTRIVYLHGFASSPASSKARFFARLLRDAGATVDIPDLAEGDFEHLTLTRQLHVIERAVAGGPVSLIGSSMGGYLAALYAERHPDEVARAVLLAPAFCFARRWAERMGEPAMDAWRSQGTLDVWHYGAGRTCPLGYGLIDDARQYPDYPDFHQPALIFHGAHDDVVPAEFAREFGASHPNARVEILDSGHELLNVLDYMGTQVLEFLKDAR